MKTNFQTFKTVFLLMMLAACSQGYDVDKEDLYFEQSDSADGGTITVDDPPTDTCKDEVCFYYEETEPEDPPTLDLPPDVEPQPVDIPVVEFNSCEDVPVEMRITVASVVEGINSVPYSSLLIRGKSIKYCICKEKKDGSGFVVHSPNMNGEFHGKGHLDSFFIRKENCLQNDREPRNQQ